jgi:TolB protein
MKSCLAIIAAALVATLTVASSATAVASGHHVRSSEGRVIIDPAAVPWGDVGPGWELVAWMPHPSSRLPVNYVELVSPYGTTYAIFATDFPTTLVAWAGDRTTALLQSGDRFEVLNLATGTLTHTFRGHVADAGKGAWPQGSFTWPEGLAAYLNLPVGGWADNAVVNERTSLTGTVEARYPGSEPTLGAFNGSMLSSADGTQVVFGAEHGLALFGNDGALEARLVMRQASGCVADRYWSAAEVLATCQDGVYARLIVFSLATGKWWPIDERPQDGSIGDFDAWRGGSTIYVQEAGACARVATLVGPEPVILQVPGVGSNDSVSVVDTTSTSVLVDVKPSCYDTIRGLYYWITPSTGAVRQILGPPLTGGWIDAIVAYPSSPSGTKQLVFS